jgi:hypothetical protein
MTGGLFAACTAIAKAGNEAVDVPSDTEMTMLDQVPTSTDVGAPDKRPEALSKLAQAGLAWMVNDSESPSTSNALGLNEYACPAVAQSGSRSAGYWRAARKAANATVMVNARATL